MDGDPKRGNPPEFSKISENARGLIEKDRIRLQKIRNDFSDLSQKIQEPTPSYITDLLSNTQRKLSLAEKYITTPEAQKGIVLLQESHSSLLLLKVAKAFYGEKNRLVRYLERSPKGIHSESEQESIQIFIREVEQNLENLCKEQALSHDPKHLENIKNFKAQVHALKTKADQIKIKLSSTTSGLKVADVLASLRKNRVEADTTPPQPIDSSVPGTAENLPHIELPDFDPSGLVLPPAPTEPFQPVHFPIDDKNLDKSLDEAFSDIASGIDDDTTEPEGEPLTPQPIQPYSSPLTIETLFKKQIIEADKEGPTFAPVFLDFDAENHVLILQESKGGANRKEKLFVLPEGTHVEVIHNDTVALSFILKIPQKDIECTFFTSFGGDIMKPTPDTRFCIYRMSDKKNLEDRTLSNHNPNETPGFTQLQEALDFVLEYTPQPEIQEEKLSPHATIALSKADLQRYLKGEKSFEKSLQFAIEGKTRAGDDVALARPDLQLWAVFDGVSSHPRGGDVAVFCADFVPEHIERMIPVDMTDPQEIESQLRELVSNLHKEVSKQQFGSSCTATITIIRGDRVYCASVGDSPSYLYKPMNTKENRLVRLNLDQNVFERIFRDYPHLCHSIQKCFDEYDGNPDHLPGEDLPIPDVSYLHQLLIQNISPAQRDSIETILDIITIHEQHGYIPAQFALGLLHNFYQLRAIITGGIGAKESSLFIQSTPYSPNDILIVDSDGFEGITPAEHASALEHGTSLEDILFRKTQFAVEAAETKRYGRKIDDQISTLYRARTAHEVADIYEEHHDRLRKEIQKIHTFDEHYQRIMELYIELYNTNKFYEASRIMRKIILKCEKIAQKLGIPYEKLPSDETPVEPPRRDFSDCFDPTHMAALAAHDTKFLHQFAQAYHWGNDTQVQALLEQRFPAQGPVEMDIDLCIILEQINTEKHFPRIDEITEQYRIKMLSSLDSNTDQLPVKYEAVPKGPRATQEHIKELQELFSEDLKIIARQTRQIQDMLGIDQNLPLIAELIKIIGEAITIGSVPFATQQISETKVFLDRFLSLKNNLKNIVEGSRQVRELCGFHENPHELTDSINLIGEAAITGDADLIQQRIGETEFFIHTLLDQARQFHQSQKIQLPAKKPWWKTTPARIAAGTLAIFGAIAGYFVPALRKQQEDSYELPPAIIKIDTKADGSTTNSQIDAAEVVPDLPVAPVEAEVASEAPIPEQKFDLGLADEELSAEAWNKGVAEAASALEVGLLKPIEKAADTVLEESAHQVRELRDFIENLGQKTPESEKPISISVTIKPGEGPSQAIERFFKAQRNDPQNQQAETWQLSDTQIKNAIWPAVKNTKFSQRFFETGEVYGFTVDPKTFAISDIHEVTPPKIETPRPAEVKPVPIIEAPVDSQAEVTPVITPAYTQGQEVWYLNKSTGTYELYKIKTDGIKEGRVGLVKEKIGKNGKPYIATQFTIDLKNFSPRTLSPENLEVYADQKIGVEKIDETHDKVRLMGIDGGLETSIFNYLMVHKDMTSPTAWGKTKEIVALKSPIPDENGKTLYKTVPNLVHVGDYFIIEEVPNTDPNEYPNYHITKIYKKYPNALELPTTKTQGE